MSLEEDARQARANALGALDGIEEAKRLILDKLQDVHWSVENQPKDLSLREAIKVLSKDMHLVSKRPCSTCQAITNALGEPFGCYYYQELHKASTASLGNCPKCNVHSSVKIYGDGRPTKCSSCGEPYA